MPPLGSPINMPPTKSDQMVEEPSILVRQPSDYARSLPVKRFQEDSVCPNNNNFSEVLEKSHQSDLTSTRTSDPNSRRTKRICTPVWCPSAQAKIPILPPFFAEIRPGFFQKQTFQVDATFSISFTRKVLTASCKYQ